VDDILGTFTLVIDNHSGVNNNAFFRMINEYIKGLVSSHYNILRRLIIYCYLIVIYNIN
jgi:hypothetical protein